METKKIIDLLISKKSHSDFESLVLEILETREKLKQPENVSFYFRKGIEQQKQRFIELEGDFKYLRYKINSNCLSELEIAFKEQKAELKRWKAKSVIRTFDGMAINAIKNRVAYYVDLIRIKKKYQHLHSLDYYLNNEEELLRLFE